ncbi:MAG: DNA adenine methylase [Bacteroidia bacterium]
MTADKLFPIREKSIKPLIKWTGGKFREFQFFKHLIPKNFDRYIEPFCGGAGVFFALQPEGEAHLNDKSSDLTEFYSTLKHPEFEKELRLFVRNWNDIKKLVDELMFDLSALFILYRQGTYDKKELKEIVFEAVEKYIDNHPSIFEKKFAVDPDNLKREIKTNIYSKFTRVLVIEQDRNEMFSEELLEDHIETAIKSGFYLHFRKMMNDSRNSKKFAATAPKRMANWFVVRELCYASMFRFNAKGEFNIPYGGIAYNQKNLEQKVNAMFSKPVKQLLGKTSFHNLDFDIFLQKVKPLKNDFIFLDPPYDSEFSEYDNMSFTKDDQKRLAETLYKIKAKWMLVIKNTPFIYSLYDKPGLHLHTFDKTYTYNVRGRNLRKAEHLIVMNYEV